jgi:DNA-binding MarR family transcriptional regulator
MALGLEGAPIAGTLNSDQPSDTVDEIVGAWREALPNVNFDQKHLVLRLLSLASNLEEIAQKACAQVGLDISLYKILSELRRVPPTYQLKPRDLIRCLPISSGGLTSLIDRAEGAGFVERRPDPLDRRGVVVALTRLGKDKIDEAARRRAEAEESVFGRLEATERETLNRILKGLQSQFSEIMPR